MRMVQDRATALAAAASRRRERIVEGSVHLDGLEGEASDWRELLERARVAISTGHHAAAAARGPEHAAEFICAAYGNELKSIGKQTENYAAWKCGGGKWRHGSGWSCGTAQQDRDPCRQGRVLPSDGDTTGTYPDYDAAWLGDIASKMQALALKAEEAADPCEKIQRVERAAAVRDWAHAASHAGASVAHRWTKVPDDWRPETVEEDVDGVRTITADPGAVIDAEREKWANLWSPPGKLKAELKWGSVPQLPRPTAGQFRQAARRIPRKTGVGVEGITPSDSLCLGLSRHRSMHRCDDGVRSGWAYSSDNCPRACPNDSKERRRKKADRSAPVPIQDLGQGQG